MDGNDLDERLTHIHLHPTLGIEPILARYFWRLSECHTPVNFWAGIMFPHVFFAIRRGLRLFRFFVSLQVLGLMLTDLTSSI
jgi:hypothetical protein